MPRLHARFANLLKIGVDQIDEDDHEADAGDESLSSDISGLSLIIEYEDAAGKTSQRVITCRQLQVRADKSYVQAYCHHRRAHRSFRLDRVIEIFDPRTGETLSPVDAFFAQFDPNKVTKSGLSWGLSVRQRADLVSLLNALVFLARCDRDFHPAEVESIEATVVKFWLEREIAEDCEIEDILDYAERLAPSGEIFWAALHKFKTDESLKRIFKTAAMQLIAADDVIQKEETYWAIEIEDFLK
ncbi:WYL domain-containing protein [Croceicoccus pelagius]|nr:WYL domain-containing protein [Croceicoccus pelagius]